jgi:hypothetical protein
MDYIGKDGVEKFINCWSTDELAVCSGLEPWPRTSSKLQHFFR